MTQVYHSATITAYEAKDDTFSAACKNMETGEIARAKGFATKEDATYAAQMMAFEIAPCTFAPIKRGNDYLGKRMGVGMTDWHEHLTAEERQRLIAIDDQRRDLARETRRLYDRARKRMKRA